MSRSVSLAFLLVLLTAHAPLAGCVAFFNKAPPPLADLRPYTDLDCTDTYGATAADITLGILAASAGILGISAGRGFGSAGVAALGAVGVAGGIAHFVSAGRGDVARCRQLKALQGAGKLEEFLKAQGGQKRNDGDRASPIAR